jgi:alkaline phosphatase D
VKRRTFLRQSVGAGLGVLFPRSLPARHRDHERTSLRYSGQAAAPALIRAPASVPALPYGVAAGDAGRGRIVIWSRADRAARMSVDYDTSERFSNARTVRGPAALEGSDFTARAVLSDVPPGQRIFYRVRFQDLTDLRAWSEPLIGSFSTAPWSGDRDVTLAWSADSVGQGWGINPDFGGMRLYETMLTIQPDLFIHCGDTIYADGPLQPEVALDDGTLWRNVVTEAKSRVAQSLDDYRGCFQYNLADAHMRRFNASVAQAVLWDDHEVRDNWYPTRDLTADARYTTKSAALLSARARQAFGEYHPLPPRSDDPERIYRTVSSGPLVDVFALDLRSYRGPNSDNRQAALGDESRIMGTAQVAWLTAQLEASRATWKVIANDMPIGLVVRDGPSHYEAIANADNGAPLGRELEIAEILRFIRARRIRNVVWVTGDVHYCAAHRYDPANARFTEFDPFWEFVAGPLHAGTFAPNVLDATFGPQVMFNGVPADLRPNRPPSAGLQFFGAIRIDARSRAMTVSLHDLAGRAIYRVELEAAV